MRRLFICIMLNFGIWLTQPALAQDFDKIVIPEVKKQSQFGYQVELSRDAKRLVVSAPYSKETLLAQGEVYTYHRNENDEWVKEDSSIKGWAVGTLWGGFLKLSDDGTTLIVGNQQRLSTDKGYVRAYNWQDSVWVEKGSLFEFEAGTFQKAIAISDNGNTILIERLINNQQTLEIYDWLDDTWVLRAGSKFQFSSTKVYSFSDDGTTLLILGYHPTNALQNYVTVYEWEEQEWKLKGEPILSEKNNDEAFIDSKISLNNNWLRINSMSEYYWRGDFWELASHNQTDEDSKWISPDLQLQAVNNGSRVTVKYKAISAIYSLDIIESDYFSNDDKIDFSIGDFTKPKLAIGVVNLSSRSGFVEIYTYRKPLGVFECKIIGNPVYINYGEKKELIGLASVHINTPPDKENEMINVRFSGRHANDFELSIFNTDSFSNSVEFNKAQTNGFENVQVRLKESALIGIKEAEIQVVFDDSVLNSLPIRAFVNTTAIHGLNSKSEFEFDSQGIWDTKFAVSSDGKHAFVTTQNGIAHVTRKESGFVSTIITNDTLYNFGQSFAYSDESKTFALLDVRNNNPVVYIYTLQNDELIYSQMIKPTDNSGSSFSIDITEPGDQIILATQSLSASRGVSVYEKKNNTWERKGSLISGNDTYSHVLQPDAKLLNDSTIAVHMSNIGSRLSWIKTYTWSSNNQDWVVLDSLIIQGGITDYQFSPDNRFLAVSNTHDLGNFENQLQYEILVLEKVQGNWSKKGAKIISINQKEYYSSNYSFAIQFYLSKDGNQIVVGENYGIYETSELRMNPQVYVFDWNGEDWVLNRDLDEADRNELQEIKSIWYNENENEPKVFTISRKKDTYNLTLQEFSFNLSTSIDEHVEKPIQTQLFQNYPNPFNPVTNLKFQLKSRAKVELSVYDVLGRKVQTLESTVLNSGEYTYSFDGSMLSSGVYFYRLISESSSQTKKMLLIK